MIFKYESRFVAFTWLNFCSLDFSLLFIVLVGRNFVSGICQLKPKNPYKPKNLFFIKKPRFFQPCINTISGQRYVFDRVSVVSK